ncbi:MAG: hydroxymethylglutaryl-CoA lyase [Desulfatibacillaceae bacterium]
MEHETVSATLSETLTHPPSGVTLREVGLRDGLQNLEKLVPTRVKAELLAGLADAGFSHIQAVSFVHPGKVPQMADAEKLLSLVDRPPGLRVSGLCLNTRGVERAAGAGVDCVEVSLSASDTHSRKNAGVGTDQALAGIADMVRSARDAGLVVWASVQCALGCVFEGRIPPERVADIAARYVELGADAVMLADTTGMGTPGSVAALLDRVRTVCGSTPLGLHMHDTRGLGLVNLAAGLARGATIFDTAFGGMGGCPFVPGAAGNVATEEAVVMLESMGIDTGIDPALVAGCSRRMEQFLGHGLFGKMYRML